MSEALLAAKKTIPSSPRRVVKVSLWLGLVLPLGWIAWKFLSIPSANPAQELIHLFGRVGYYMLALNLTIGSVLAFFKIVKKPWPRSLNPVLPFRRHLGVAGVLYLTIHVAFHFLNEAGIPEGLAAIVKAKYLWVGVTAYLGHALLATTSNDASMRRLKRRWKTLHRAAYPLFFIATLHTLMIEKADLLHFGLIATVVAVPLALRFTRWILLKNLK